MHQSQLHSIDELKKCLLDVWYGMDQSVIIDDAIDGRHKHLRAHRPIRAKRRTLRAAVVNLTIALSAEPYDKIYFVSSNITFVICRKFELNFPQVVRQHTLGVAGYIIYGFCLKFTLLSDSERILTIGIGFDKVITTSWVVHFFGTQCT